MEEKKTTKCSSCGLPQDRPGYCKPCLATFRKVRKWLGGDLIIQQGPLFTLVEPDDDVRAWLVARGKLPDLQALRNEAMVRSIRHILAT